MHFLIHEPKTNLRKMIFGMTPKLSPPRVQGDAGIIPIVGVLSQRSDGWFECGSTYADIGAALEAFENDPSIKRIVFDVDSCGGSADGVFELAERIRAATKPTASYGRGVVASAALILAAAAKTFTAHRSSMIGSVGAYECYYIGDSDEIKYIVSDQSPNKVPDPTTPEGEAVLKKRVNGLAAMFISDLAAYRNTTPEKVESDYGGGEMLFADAALAVGMIDGIGNFKAALANAENVSLSIDNPSTVQPQAQHTPVTQKIKSTGGRHMALILTDDANVTQGAETLPVTAENIKDKFPDVYKKIQDDATAAAAEAAAEVEAVAEMADEENPAEMDAVAQARAGKMTANDLRIKLLTEKHAFAKSDAGLRARAGAQRRADNPPVVTAGAHAGKVTPQTENPGTIVGTFKKLMGRKQK